MNPKANLCQADSSYLQKGICATVLDPLPEDMRAEQAQSAERSSNAASYLEFCVGFPCRWKGDIFIGLLLLQWFLFIRRMNFTLRAVAEKALTLWTKCFCVESALLSHVQSL